MKGMHILAATLMLSAGAAVAQTADPPKTPGGNVPQAQSPCAQGYGKAVSNGQMRNLSPQTMRAVDTNNDGRISKAEFDAACTKNLFGQQDNQG